MKIETFFFFSCIKVKTSSDCIFMSNVLTQIRGQSYSRLFNFVELKICISLHTVTVHGSLRTRRDIEPRLLKYLLFIMPRHWIEPFYSCKCYQARLIALTLWSSIHIDLFVCTDYVFELWIFALRYNLQYDNSVKWFPCFVFLFYVKNAF